ncbi:endopolyphosphatase [Aspergillus homomorphus CBS 101889]|uniref:Endopolyphosphatase n=1 Tax=Aspergillus homomorphus (strain CBS 101889) TaxID=1450537 RepID=A0A395HW06_ASPHC|nr:endopolyphosphatase [Aspergillus homomorphus CBS 101889]RAL10404.1 endopolyphosphatase [Aspergillus homomorphus CBS 101889]
MIPSQLLPALVLLATCACAFPLFDQQLLGNNGISQRPQLEAQVDVEPTSRGLSGRFLHITDLHPDSYYKPGTSPDKACHRGDGSAGYFGSEGTECDAPITLINETFRWIEKNLKGKVDFIIWTGDSARHDNDEKKPREPEEVLELNKLLAEKFVETFKDDNSVKGISIPIIPTFGNNDIMPHNIFKAGPNRWTKQYREIWSNFIPEYQLHSFVEGGWFISEVIPEKLAVVSLNTMYFFDSNSAVDGCAAKSEPGYEHMEWLRVQLEMLRGRHMKAILMGHVPPARAGTKRNWDESCWQKYTLWLHQFRDVVVGSVYGHMNLDHFMLQDSHKVDIVSVEESSVYLGGSGEDELSTQSRSDYLSSLRKDWSKLPSVPAGTSKSFSMDEWFDEDETSILGSKKKKRFLKKIGGPFAERYSVSLVSPSVVPNYFPTLRVVEYNITGLEHAATWASTPFRSSIDSVSLDMEDDSPLSDAGEKQSKKPHFEVPAPPSKTTPPGPAYSNQALSWLSYTQYYANLTRINSQMTTRERASDGAEELTASKRDDVFAYEVEYDTRDDKVYKMDDLTVRSFFKLASRIAKRGGKKANKAKSSSLGDMEEADLDDFDAGTDYGTQGIEAANFKKHKNRVWKTFVTRAFVGLLQNDDIDDIN